MQNYRQYAVYRTQNKIGNHHLYMQCPFNQDWNIQCMVKTSHSVTLISSQINLDMKKTIWDFLS